MDAPLQEKIVARSLVDAIAERIEVAIASGELHPGCKVSEQALAAYSGSAGDPSAKRCAGSKAWVPAKRMDPFVVMSMKPAVMDGVRTLISYFRRCFLNFWTLKVSRLLRGCNVQHDI